MVFFALTMVKTASFFAIKFWICSIFYHIGVTISYCNIVIFMDMLQTGLFSHCRRDDEETITDRKQELLRHHVCSLFGRRRASAGTSEKTVQRLFYVLCFASSELG
jgi:hypothetical protein